MFCRNPYLETFACGSCIPCKLKKRKEWTGRILLEQQTAPVSLFVTLTYAPESLVYTDLDAGLPTLYPRHLTLFLKSLRKAGNQLRYFACGEYGTENDRPHYHLCIFATSSFDHSSIAKNWPHGFVSISLLNEKRAAYIAQYCLKKLTKPTDEILEGRYPEFSRQSRRPVLGSLSVERLVRMYQTSSGARFIAERGDVVPFIKIGSKSYPLGKTILREIRSALGIPLKQDARIAANPRAADFASVNYCQDELDSIQFRMEQIYEKAVSQNLTHSRL